MINVAVISAWHVHAKGYAREAAANENCNVVGVWDSDKKVSQDWADELGCKAYESWQDILADENVDGIILNSPTNEHPEILIASAKAGKHIFTEKVLALKNTEAEEIEKEVKESGIKFTISYPHKCRDTLQFAKKIISEGKLGTMTYARVRNVHGGSIANWLPAHFYDREQCGGGAMIDLGAHPMYTLEWMLGKPVSVQSLFTNITDRPVEDNAVCLIEFEGGAIGVSETGFVSTCDKYVFEASGTKGAVRVIGDDVAYSCEETEKQWVNAELEQMYIPSPINYWIDSILGKNDGTMFGIDDAVSLTALMDAAYRSYESGSKEKV